MWRTSSLAQARRAPYREVIYTAYCAMPYFYARDHRLEGTNMNSRNPGENGRR
jgi:hypothetical protein